MRDPNQTMRFNDYELSLIKGWFADDAPILYAIRKVMFQFELDDSEQDEVDKLIGNKEASELIRKIFLPQLDPDAPLFQLTTLAIALGADTKTLSPEASFPYILCKQLESDYIAQQLDVLLGEKVKPKIVFQDLADLDYKLGDEMVAWVHVTAFNFLLSYIDSNIAQLKVLAGLKTETVEQTKERLRRDSTQ